jgi:hypothetical protein
VTTFNREAASIPLLSVAPFEFLGEMTDETTVDVGVGGRIVAEPRDGDHPL